jgi:hypothetical protein
MPYTKESLQNLFSLSKEDVDQTLLAAKLPVDREEYSDEEIKSFEAIRNLLSEGKARDYAEAASIFEEQQNSLGSTKKSKTRKKSSDSSKLLDFSDLLNTAKSNNYFLSPKEAIKLLEICGIAADAENYSEEQSEKFLEMCRLYKKEGKSLEELALIAGLQIGSFFEDEIEKTVVALENSGTDLVNEIMRAKAKADADAARSLYLQHLASQFGSPEFQKAWKEMEEQIKNAVLGKLEARLQQRFGTTKLRSSQQLTGLPKALDSGSTNKSSSN